MKQLSILLLSVFVLAIATSKVKAQGGFGGFHVSSELTENGNLLMIGGGGAWVIDSNFYLGGAGYGRVNTLTTNSGELSSFGYGGVMIGYFHEIRNSVRLGGDLLSGSGGYTIDQLEEDSFFFLEPNIKIWYSINRSMHFSAGVYYRIAYLNADAVLTEQDLSNFGIKLSVNFGKL